MYGWLFGLTYPNKWFLTAPHATSLDIPLTMTYPLHERSYQGGVQVYNL
jgi:hypothetical protein